MTIVRQQVADALGGFAAGLTPSYPSPPPSSPLLWYGLSPPLSSAAPSVAPSQAPSAAPTQAPSVVPSQAPSVVPSQAPSIAPSLAPSASPEGSVTHSVSTEAEMRTAIDSSLDGDVILITANLTLTTIQPGWHEGAAHFTMNLGKALTIRGDCPDNTACITLDANNANGNSPRTRIFYIVDYGQTGVVTTVENLRFINVGRLSL